MEIELVLTVVVTLLVIFAAAVVSLEALTARGDAWLKGERDE